jgi:LemA protein
MDNNIKKINALAESYPDLKANENFKTLQLTIADVEEHLQAARRLYNSNVSIYNQKVEMFPSSIIAKNRNLVKKDFFEAEEAQKEDVKINF